MKKKKNFSKIFICFFVCFFALYEFYLKLFCKIVIFLYECIFYCNNKKFLSDKFDLLFCFTLFH